MLKKKVKKREAKVNTPIEDLDTKETIMHYNAVLLEEQNSKFQLVLEGMDALSARVNRKIENLSVQVDQKIDALSARLNLFEDRTEKRFSTIEFALRGLKDDMMDMERRICSKINRVSERCDNHEYRLNMLEANQ